MERQTKNTSGFSGPLSRTLCTALALVFAIFLLPVTRAYAIEQVASGSFGNDNGVFSWNLYDDGTLNIVSSNVGSNKLQDFESRQAPWYKWRSQITKIVLPQGVTAIGAHNFSDCAVTEIEIPASVASIGEGAFLNTSLTGVIVPGSVKTIGGSAFSSCSSLASVSLSDGLESIGSAAFSGCPITNLTVPDSVTNIGEGAFSECISLREITLPAGITEIPKNLFKKSRALEKIVIPDGVKSIGAGAFVNCTGLKEVTIPRSVETIKTTAFSYNPEAIGIMKIETVYYKGTRAEWNTLIDEGKIESYNTQLLNAKYIICIDDARYSGELDGGLSWKLTYEDTLVISGTGPMPSFDDGNAPWKEYHDLIRKVVVEDGVTSVGSKSFGLSGADSYSKLKEVELADSVESIGFMAFANSGLETFVIPDGVKTLGGNLFEHTAIKEIIIPGTVERITSGALQNCDSLETVIIEEGKLKTVPQNFCLNCKKLKKLVVPSTVEEIKHYIIGYSDNDTSVLSEVVIESTGTLYPQNDTVHNFQNKLAPGAKVTVACGLSDENGVLITEENYKRYFSCKGVGEIEFKLIHGLRKVDQAPATCTEAGHEEYWECKTEGCGKMFSDAEGQNPIDAPTAVPPAGHSYKKTASVSPTCDKDGNIAYWSCETCGKLFYDEQGKPEIDDETKIVLASPGHDWSDWTVTAPATFEKTGTEEHSCKREGCGKKETRDTEKLEENKHYKFKKSSYSWTKRSDKDLTVIIKNTAEDGLTYENFRDNPDRRLVLDNKATVSESNYTYKEGSLEVSFKASYLESLSTGTHTITAYFWDGTASAELMIKSAGSGDTPGTNDDMSTAAVICVILSFLLSLIFIAYSLFSNELIRAKLIAAFSGNDGSRSALAGETGGQTGDGFEEIISNVKEYTEK